MIYSVFLPRRVSQGGCVVAGTRLSTARTKLKDTKVKLVPKVDTSVQKVLDRTRDIEARVGAAGQPAPALHRQF